MTIIKALNYASVAAASAAALLLYWASLSLEWRSWTQETTAEKRRKLRNRVLAAVGVPCVFIAAGCQAAAIYLTPN